MRSSLGTIANVIFMGAALAQQQTQTHWPLPNGMTLGDVPARELVGTDTLPSTIALSPDKRYAALLNAGFGSAEMKHRQTIVVYDLAGKTFRKSSDSLAAPRQSYFLGLAFAPDGKRLYASVVSTAKERPNGIAVFRFDGGAITYERLIELPMITLPPTAQANLVGGNKNPHQQYAFPAGLAVVGAPAGDQLLVAANLADCALLIDAASGRILHRFDLRISKHVPASFPFTAAASASGARGYVSLWNGSQVAVLDLTGGSVLRRIDLRRSSDPRKAGSHPTAMLLSADGGTLFVTLGNRDEIAVVSTASGRVERYLSTRTPRQQYLGAVPSALALSEDGGTLFAADAGTDNVALFDLASSSTKASGFFSTQWWPQALAVRGGELLVVTARGHGTGPKLTSYDEQRPLSMDLGSLARVEMGEVREHLAELTAQADEVVAPEASQELPPQAAAIKHVIYVIKENRSYDQMFGDLGVGNGEASLTLFGEEITPNQHRLAREFGVLDDFYDSGDVSGEGHVWSTAATATDYLERTIELAYTPQERTYDYEGVVQNRIPLEDDIADVNEPATGYLWTAAAKHGLSYRHYGEFISTTWCYQPDREPEPYPRGVRCQRPKVSQGESLPPRYGRPGGSASPWKRAVRLFTRNTATKPELIGHFDPYYPDFNLEFPDQLRADEFLNEFSGFVKARDRGDATHELPNYVLLRLPNDHSSGTKPELPTPAAAIADNDLALGRVVESVSHSPYWKDTAILVLEDDAQYGADHVDSHRSICLAISAYSPSSATAPKVDSTFYTTVSVIRTIEALLGMPPMNASDARARVMATEFSGNGLHPPFTADDRNQKNGLLYQVNPENGPGAKQSLRMDFSHADAADPVALNTVLWHAMKGEEPLPRAIPAGERNRLPER